MAQSKAERTRIKLIEAAVEVLQREGFTALTLDAVAAQAGVSKGGLLYHFDSKEALLEGMLRYYLEEVQAELEARAAAHPEQSPSQTWLQASIKSSFDISAEENAVNLSLLAAAAVNPAILLPLRDRWREWHQQYEASSHDPALAVIVSLAIDGLWLREMLGFTVLDPEMREAVRERLKVLLKDL
jgi:AcrR family transcriptional regulator